MGGARRRRQSVCRHREPDHHSGNEHRDRRGSNSYLRRLRARKVDVRGHARILLRTTSRGKRRDDPDGVNRRTGASPLVQVLHRPDGSLPLADSSRYRAGNGHPPQRWSRHTPMQTIETQQWRRYGFGGPPEPWERGAQRDLDRLATSYYVDALESRRQIMGNGPEAETRAILEELFTTATRHKHEIDYTLRHWATPVERARVEDRLGSLMRISRKLREMANPDPEPLRAA